MTFEMFNSNFRYTL